MQLPRAALVIASYCSLATSSTAPARSSSTAGQIRRRIAAGIVHRILPRLTDLIDTFGTLLGHILADSREDLRPAAGR